MNKYLKIFFFIVGFGIFYYLLQSFGIEQLAFYLKNSGWTIFWALAIWLIVYLLNSYCYKLIVNGDAAKITFAKAFKISIASFALNYITPFLSLGGEAYRAIAIREETGDSKTKSVSSTLLYNMLHILSHLFFWLSGAICLFFVYPLSNLLILEGGAAISVLSIAIYFMMSRHKKGLVNSIIKPLSKINFIEKLFNRNLDKIENLLKLDDEITELYHKRKSDFYKGLGAEYLARIVASLEFYAILYFLNINVNIFQAVYIHAISSLMLNITFFIPMEMGAREASMYFVLGSVSGDASIGVFVAVINRIREFFWIFIGLATMQLNKFLKSEPIIKT